MIYPCLESALLEQAGPYLCDQVGDVKAKAEETRERLEKMRGSLLLRKDLLRVVVAEKALKHQAKRAQLQENSLQARNAGGLEERGSCVLQASCRL